MHQLQYVGIDVSSRSLEVRLRCSQQQASQVLHFPNTPTGHKGLIRRLTKRHRQARVVLEATGIYSLDLALALDRGESIEVMVANPRAVKAFADATSRRSKTDAIDAQILLEFVERMEFQPWQAPCPARLNLRTVMRRLQALVQQRIQEKSRLHAAQASHSTPTLVHEDLQLSLEQLDERIQLLSEQARKIAAEEAQLNRDFERLVSVPGIAQTSALKILAEICLLPRDMTARQWVAHAGLDPLIQQSGLTSKQGHISKRGNKNLRASLYMPALVALQYDPNIKAFYEHLLANRKVPKQAVIAIMRKMLHAIHGMLRTNSDFQGEKFYRLKHRSA